MRKYHSILFVVFSIAVISACSGPDVVLDPDRIVMREEGKHLISTTAATRHTVVSDKNSNSYICIEPPPDAATSADLNVDFGFTIVNLSGDDHADDQQDVDMEGLGGRSANVLIVRDLLYRTCELFINSNFTDDQKMGLFRDVLRTIERVGTTKLEVGTPPGERRAMPPPKTAASDGTGSGQSDQTATPKSCSSNPEGGECSNYCVQNPSNTTCAAICSASGNLYNWCLQ